MVSKQFSIAVTVSDAKKSARWFEEKLGFESSVDDHWVLVWPRGSTAKIHLCEDELDPGNTGIAFYLKNAEKFADKIRQKGVKITEPVKKKSWGVEGMFADPDDNEYYLIEGTGP
jgi:catechol 2,3-dioxygenase-like lactoylglutathione lyase family enzyme